MLLNYVAIILHKFHPMILGILIDSWTSEVSTSKPMESSIENIEENDPSTYRQRISEHVRTTADQETTLGRCSPKDRRGG